MLIDDDGVLDTIHGYIFESDFISGQRRRRVVALDSCAVGRLGHGAAREGDVPNAQFIGTLAKTPDGKSVSGPAFESFDEDVFAAGANGDAIVSGSNDRVGDLDVSGIAEMDSVGVRAILGGGDGEASHLDIDAVDKLAMESHSVDKI